MADASSSQIERMDKFGLNLGIAFQMMDDILDVIGNKELLGKPTGIDLRDGNPSLPIVLSVGNGETPISNAFKTSHPTVGLINTALKAMCNGTVIDQSLAFSRKYASKAFSPIEDFPSSPYMNGMKAMIKLMLERNS